MTTLRHYRWHDKLLISTQKCLHRGMFNLSSATSNRANPGANVNEHPLSLSAKRLSGALMRINHSGEVCAQALYWGQSFTARDPKNRQAFEQAAKEEADHLSWCEQRLSELSNYQSYLNPLWFAGSLTIGAFAGLIGDRFSLGFLAETERQVFRHLEKHLERLPPEDEKSRKIVMQMQLDEAKHAITATDLGAMSLPIPIKMGMQFAAKVMTSITYYV